MPETPTLSELDQSVKAGLSWLSDLQHQSGEYSDCGTDLAGYYKSPLLFAECGSVNQGIRCLTFIRENFLTSDSQLRSGTRKTSLGRMERNLANYMDGWIALGAWILGEFNLAEQLAQRLMRAQARSHGGIETGPIEWAGRKRYDLATVASCGRAFLRIGHRDAAIAAGRFLCEALEHQDDLSAGLNLTFTSDWVRLETEDESERTYYWFDLSKRGEKVWFPAFSCGFLSELYDVLRDGEFLDAARKYYEFILATPDYKDGSLANGKSAWAAGRLANITREDKYWEAFMKIAPNVIGRQATNGEFLSSSASGATVDAKESNEDRGPMIRRTERTAEFSMWVSEYIKLISVRM